MIYGRVLDSQSSAIAGAQVVVTNNDTNVPVHLKSNGTGYYEASLLLPGAYQVSVDAPGFRKVVRGGIQLQVSSRVEIELKLEVGSITETINVTAEAPMLDTSAVSSGRVMDKHFDGRSRHRIERHGSRQAYARNPDERRQQLARPPLEHRKLRLLHGRQRRRQ
jgi:hypothetical protein